MADDNKFGELKSTLIKAKVNQPAEAESADKRRDRTSKPGQYALDLVADAVALEHFGPAPVRILSEESGVHEHAGADITVVVDPVE